MLIIFFLFFKNYFWYQHVKTIQKVQTAFNFSKKKKIENFQKAGLTAVPNGHLGPDGIGIKLELA